RCAATGVEIREFEEQLIYENGEARSLFGNAVPLRDHSGQPRGCVAAFIDISALDQAMSALRQERSLFVGGPAVVWKWRNQPGWPVEYVSSNVDQFGYTSEDFTNGRTRFADILHPDDLPRVADEVASHVAANRDRFEQQYRVRDSAGKYHTLYDFTIVARDPRGNVTHFQGYTLDATEHALAQERLIDSERRYAAIFDNNPQPLWVYEVGTLRMLEVNRATLDLFGYGREEFLKLTLADLVAPVDRERLRHAASIVQGLTRTGPWRAVRKGGSEFDAEVFGNDLSLGDRPSRIVMLTDVTDRLAAERALRESEDRYRQFFDTNQAVKLVIDPADGAIIEANDAAVEFYGHTRDELLRKKITEINTAGEAVLKPLFAQSALSQHRFEFVHRLASGELRDVEVYTGPITIKGRRLLFSIIHDATERKEAERKLRDSEATNRALLDALPDMLFRVDRNGRYLSYHAQNEADLYVPPEQFLGRTIREVMPPDRAERCMISIEAALRTNSVHRYEINEVIGGSQRWWEVRVAPRGESEALLVLRDVTESHSARSLVRDLQQRRELMFNFAPVGIIFLETDFTMIEWNPAAERIFGFSAQQAVGASGNLIIPAADQPIVTKVWRQLLDERRMVRSTNRNITADGRIIICEWYNAPLVDAAGNTFAVLSIVEDVTERKEAERQQSLMIAELDHRVKNNLATIVSLAEQTGRSESNYQEFLKSFLGRVRALARMHSALAHSKWRGAPLATIATQTLGAFSPRRTAFEISGPPITLTPKYAQAISLALHELATNAAKYGALHDGDGKVALSWRMLGAQSDGPDPHATAQDATIELTWVESGGPPVVPPSGLGFGSELIKGMIEHELRGTVDIQYNPEGVRCLIRVPAPTPEEHGDLTNA
ncbi:MAG: PAS domain S-box protein, partial [Phycisphaeraceae bacterium]|nr:PAS domain S-box protein [Phycisphaeraceae bacterium]